MYLLSEMFCYMKISYFLVRDEKLIFIIMVGYINVFLNTSKLFLNVLCDNLSGVGLDFFIWNYFTSKERLICKANGSPGSKMM